MRKQRKEDHLDVYQDRSELFLGNNSPSIVFSEGPQDMVTQSRYRKIVEQFRAGFLDKVYRESVTGKHDLLQLSEEVCDHLKNMVAAISASGGRALTGLVFLQLAVKAIAPKQSVRLHKGGSSRSDFSWRQGISFRSLDKDFSSPFLRDNRLLEINRDGVMMTRTLAENYPYTKLYKARMAGPASDWMALVDGMENNMFDPLLALSFLMSALKNRSEKFFALADETLSLVDALSTIDLDDATTLLSEFVASTEYSARAFEVVMHALVQAMNDVGIKLRGVLAPLSQMRSANKKAGNIGDIELLSPEGKIVESWDAKFGKPYLWDELVELGDKLVEKPGAVIAGFVTDGDPMLPNDLLNRKREISKQSGTQVEIFSFRTWVRIQTGNMSPSQRDSLPKAWLKAVTESFGRKRLDVAPIDEPCDIWLADVGKALKRFSDKKM
ncbi:MAG: hypothetical protein J6334_08405 [Kiritimatiellae bacterium]|nr:hypothetical protein [Kiritimatiellia bacterium]